MIDKKLISIICIICINDYKNKLKVKNYPKRTSPYIDLRIIPSTVPLQSPSLIKNLNKKLPLNLSAIEVFISRRIT